MLPAAAHLSALPLAVTRLTPQSHPAGVIIYRRSRLVWDARMITRPFIRLIQFRNQFCPWRVPVSISALVRVRIFLLCFAVFAISSCGGSSSSSAPPPPLPPP